MLPPTAPDGAYPPTVPAGIRRLDAELVAAAAPAPAKVVPGEILIITGMSGAGKTLAAGALQDRGWYVVDNIPPRLIQPLAGMMTPTGDGVQQLAVVVDIRSRRFFETLAAALDSLKAQGLPYRVVFLDARDDVLVRRFEQTRRPHPLQQDGTVLSGIARERAELEGAKLRADVVVDTSDLTVNALAGAIDRAAGLDGPEGVVLTVESFGFKYGLPMDANHVVDVRFLENPYWVDELRKLTGQDQPVKDYVMGLAGARDFLDRYAGALRLALDGYVRERKQYVTVAVGCTGGKHRSVVITEALGEALRGDATVRVLHRDLGRE
jgi:UPF0042 nucleotide-binding protein